MVCCEHCIGGVSGAAERGGVECDFSSAAGRTETTEGLGKEGKHLFASIKFLCKSSKPGGGGVPQQQYY